MSKKKKAGELTTEALARRLFPKEVRDEVKKEVSAKPKKSEKSPAIEKKGS